MRTLEFHQTNGLRVRNLVITELCFQTSSNKELVLELHQTKKWFRTTPHKGVNFRSFSKRDLHQTES